MLNVSSTGYIGSCLIIQRNRSRSGKFINLNSVLLPFALFAPTRLNYRGLMVGMKGTPITEQLYDYIVDTFAPEDDLLKRMPAEAEAKGIPLIHISPEQGKFLQVMMAAVGAKRVLEVGSLFGYSTLWMARALPAHGTLIALELSMLHAEATRENLARAGLADRTEVRQGDARDLLPKLVSEAPFDLAFIDAEKAQYVDYFEQVVQLMRPGGMIIADNASANGEAWQANPQHSRDHILAIRAMNQRMANDPRLISLLVPISDGMCVGVVR
jgi:caffeoyl-CoA O-methyltransferase